MATVSVRSISTYDSQVRFRVPLSEAEKDPKVVPQHFTNLHLGLRLARRILSRRGAYLNGQFVLWSSADRHLAHVSMVQKDDLVLLELGIKVSGRHTEVRVPVPPGGESLARKVARRLMKGDADAHAEPV